MTTLFKIENGDIVQKSSIKNAFDLPDGFYELEIKKKGRRSIQANRYYWGVCVKMVREGIKELGHDLTIDETHDFLKGRFNSKQLVNEDTGEVLSIPKSTTDLNKQEFGEYIEQIQRFAAEFLSVVIPDAGEQMMISYE